MDSFLQTGFEANITYSLSMESVYPAELSITPDFMSVNDVYLHIMSLSNICTNVGASGETLFSVF